MELRAISDLARIKASSMAGFAVILGITIASTEPSISTTIIFGFFVGFFISASTNTINDILDYDIDLFEKPNRPIPRKGITINEAKILFILETIIGLIIALYLNFYSFFLSASVAILSVIYSWRLKNILLVKNLLTSFGVSSALLVGVFATNPTELSMEILLFFLLIFIAVVAFEMHKDMADVEGDRKNKKKTIPVVLGTQQASLIVIFLYLVGIIFYHGILVITSYQFTPIFWGMEIIIFIALVPLFKLIIRHDDVEYIHTTRKLIMGVLLLITISLIATFLT